MESQQQGEQQTMLSSLKGISKQQYVMTTATVLGSLGIDLMTHFDAGSVFFGAVAIVLAARHGKDVLDLIVPGNDVAKVRETSARILDALSPAQVKTLQAQTQDDTATTSKLKRLVGMKTPTPAVLKTGREVAPSDAVTERLEDDGLIDFSAPDDEDELFSTPRTATSGKFLFTEVLSGFTPTLNKIYLGTLPSGAQLFCEAKDLCHVALAGSTGGGKTSIMRMLMAQLCIAGARVLLLNPHYTRYDVEADEDWTPFEPYLYRDPMECRSYEVIGQYLKQVATEVLPKRLDKYAHSQPLGKPYFLVLDELPAIVHHVKDAPEYLSAILREGRKVGIFLIVASQDFLVKTLFPNGGGGAVRECFRTAIYVGGDATTARILLDMPANQVPESDLGKGTVMMRNKAVKAAAMTYVPYVDNAALYRLLGPSTFKQRTIVEEDELPTWEEMTAELNKRPDREEQRLHLVGNFQGNGHTAEMRASEASQTLRETGKGITGNNFTEALNTLSEPFPAIPDPFGNGPQLGKDDKAFSQSQEQDFLRRFRKNPDIQAVLRQMPNTRGGIGLGNRYYKYAKWLVENKLAV